MLAKLDGIADRPIEVSVTTRLDGRQIAQAVYKDIRERKSRTMRRCEKRVFICSRYAGDVERNVSIAVALCRMAIEAGCAPFAPHLLYARFLDDNDPAERERAITLGLAFMAVCDEVWVYVGEGVSDGMRQELEYARKLGKPVVEIREVELCART